MNDRLTFADLPGLLSRKRRLVKTRVDVPFALARALQSSYFSLREWPRLPFTARINDPPSKLARFSPHGMAPVLVPLRRRARLSEDPSKLARHAICPGEEASDSSTSLEGVVRLIFTARIERRPLYRGGSASKKNGLPTPSHHSEAARCASTEDHQAPSTPLLRKQGTGTRVIPSLFTVRVLRARRAPGRSLSCWRTFSASCLGIAGPLARAAAEAQGSAPRLRLCSQGTARVVGSGFCAGCPGGGSTDSSAEGPRSVESPESVTGGGNPDVGLTRGQAFDRVWDGVREPRFILVAHETKFQSRALDTWAYRRASNLRYAVAAYWDPGPYDAAGRRRSTAMGSVPATSSWVRQMPIPSVMIRREYRSSITAR